LLTACVSGKFGDKCTQTCHCISKSCDPIYGTCSPGGCQRGYTGVTCNTGMYKWCYLTNWLLNIMLHNLEC
jgi:hypothetical protein